MTHPMIRQLELVLSHCGTGLETQILTADNGDDWQWKVKLEGGYYIAFTGTLFGCQEIDRRYKECQ